MNARDEDETTLSDNELVGECNGLFVAGYDTSAQTLAWTLLLLSQHPEVMGPLVEEVGGAAPTAASVGRMPVLDSVVKESMRLMPASAMLFIRVCAEFAALALRLMLARILQRFRPALVEGAKVDRAVRGIAMAPKRGLKMRLEAPPVIPRPVRWSGDVRELFRAPEGS